MAVIRVAGPGDAAGMGKAQVESWRTTYPGLIPDAYLIGLSARKAAARWRLWLTHTERSLRTFVAEDPELGIFGFGTCGRQRTQLADYGGEFFALYLLDHAQGRGLGRKLMSTMASHLIEQGMRSAVVWVLRDNPARWFYERLGGIRLAEQTIRFAGGTLVETAYGWRDLTPVVQMTANRRVE